MRRFLLSLSICLGTLLPFATTANAQTLDLPCGSDGSTYSVQLPEGLVLDGRNCSGSLVIDNRVKVIGDEAFWRSKVTAVIIPSSVTSIGNSAFYGGRLASLTITNSVVHIGTRAFFGTQLTSVTIPTSLKSIENNVFAGTKITEVTIPNSVVSIGIGAFYNTPITSIIIPNAVTSIGGYAFSGTLITSVVIPNSVKDIGPAAFYRAPITSVTIPNSVQSIGIGAFAETKLTTVVVPDSVKEIGSFAFADIPTLSIITIPEGVSNLNPNIVERDIALTKIMHCGALPGFSVSPTCSPERRAQIAAEQATAAKARTKPGTRCIKLGAISISGRYKYTCIKSGKKLIWNKGAKVVTATLTPTFSVTPKPPKDPFKMYEPRSSIMPNNSISVSAITKPPLSMLGINTNQYLWGGSMDPAFVTLGPKNGTAQSTDAYSGKVGVEIEAFIDQPILAPMDARFIGFESINADYFINLKANSGDGAIKSPSSNLQLCFESSSSDWPGLVFCFYHLGNSPLLAGIGKDSLCGSAKEYPGLFRAQGWLFYTSNDGFILGDTISTSCKALLGREVKRGDVIAYSGTTGPHSQAPITMKVQDRSINPTVKQGNKNFHWVQGDVFFYWKCYSPTATFEPGVLAYPWECGGYKVPKEQNSIQFKYQK